MGTLAARTAKGAVSIEVAAAGELPLQGQPLHIGPADGAVRGGSVDARDLARRAKEAVGGAAGAAEAVAPERLERRPRGALRRG